MVGVHNAFIRAINSAYLQAPYVKSGTDLHDLAAYVGIWIYTLHKHHRAEETVAFPGMMRVSNGELGKETAQNLEQHEMLDRKLHELESWCKEDPEKEGWVDELRKRIELAMDVIHVHLTEEIPTLQALVKYDPKAVRRVIDEVKKEVKAESDYVSPTRNPKECCC